MLPGGGTRRFSVSADGKLRSRIAQGLWRWDVPQWVRQRSQIVDAIEDLDYE
jgi:hypothetical protein